MKKPIKRWLGVSRILVAIHSNYIFKSNNLFEDISYKDKYLPIFDTSSWEPSPEDFSSIFYDNFNNEIQLDIGHDFLHLSFVGSQKPATYFYGQKIRLGIDSKNNFVSIEIFNLSFQELEFLNSFF